MDFSSRAPNQMDFSSRAPNQMDFSSRVPNQMDFSSRAPNQMDFLRGALQLESQSVSLVVQLVPFPRKTFFQAGRPNLVIPGIVDAHHKSNENESTVGHFWRGVLPSISHHILPHFLGIPRSSEDKTSKVFAHPDFPPRPNDCQLQSFSLGKFLLFLRV